MMMMKKEQNKVFCQITLAQTFLASERQRDDVGLPVRMAPATSSTVASLFLSQSGLRASERTSEPASSHTNSLQLLAGIRRQAGSQAGRQVVKQAG